MELDFSEVLFSIAKILHVNAAENPSRCFCSALLSLCTELLLEINVSRIFIQLCAAEGHAALSKITVMPSKQGLWFLLASYIPFSHHS